MVNFNIRAGKEYSKIGARLSKEEVSSNGVRLK
jgi:hypothetical protein